MIRRSVGALLVALVLVVTATANAAPTWKSPMDLGPVAPSPMFGTPPIVELDSKGNSVVLIDNCTSAITMCEASEIILKTRRGRAGSAWTSTTVAPSGAGMPDLDVSPGGHAAAVWTVVRPSPHAVHVMISTRTPGGTWTTPKRVSGLDDVGFWPKVAIDDRGATVVVWQQQEASDYIAMYRQRSASGTWSAGALASRPGYSASAPDVSVNPSGAGLILFPGGNDTPGQFSMWARTRSSRTASWGAATSISASGTNTASFRTPEGAVTNSGQSFAAWLRHNGSSYVVEGAERIVGDPWSAPTDVSGASADIFSMDDAPNGRVVVVWQGGSMVRGRKHLIGGSWTTATDLPATPGFTTLRNSVAVNAAGRVVYTTSEYMSDSGEPDNYDMVIRSARSSATQEGWGTLVDVSPPDPNTQLGTVSIDPQGNALATGTTLSPTRRYEAFPLDAAGPLMASLRVPRSGRDDTAIRFSVAPYDVWTALTGKTKWTFGDGKSALGNSVTHKYARPGTYTVKATRADSLGNRTTVTRTIRINP